MDDKIPEVDHKEELIRRMNEVGAQFEFIKVGEVFRMKGGLYRVRAVGKKFIRLERTHD